MADIEYTPKFRHEPWVDNVDPLQAGGKKGFNQRFSDIEAEFKEIKWVIGQIIASLENLPDLSDALNNIKGNLTVEGNVGIGVPDPAQPLEVMGNVASGGIVRVANNGEGGVALDVRNIEGEFNTVVVWNENPNAQVATLWVSNRGSQAAAGHFINDNNSNTDPALIAGASKDSFAAKFDGKVEVTGLLEKKGGGFKIDHPLDPDNKYLYHSFVESPDMKNVYDGTAMLDEKGEAWIELPAWFEALNRDFRYQLTAVGMPAPNLHVAKKIQDNRFKISGGISEMEVTWQVTGIRQDLFAKTNPIPVEIGKV